MTSSVTLPCEHPLSHAQGQAAHILPKRNNHDNGTTQNKATKHPTLAALRNTAATGRSLVALIRMAIAHGHPPWPPTPSPLAIIYYVGAYGLHTIMQ